MDESMMDFIPKPALKRAIHPLQRFMSYCSHPLKNMGLSWCKEQYRMEVVTVGLARLETKLCVDIYTRLRPKFSVFIKTRLRPKFCVNIQTRLTPKFCVNIKTRLRPKFWIDTKILCWHQKWVETKILCRHQNWVDIKILKQNSEKVQKLFQYSRIFQNCREITKKKLTNLQVLSRNSRVQFWR